MVKLSPELINQAAQYTNPVRDRELLLRGFKIPVIENLGATLDQFDTIDLSDNDIRKVDGFCLLKRLKCLLLNNNRIVRFGEHLEEYLPQLESIIVTSNAVQDLGDIEPLVSITTLRTLSLLKNPITTKKHYRLYVIHKLPQLRLLDFRKIKQKEREDSAALFKSRKGKQLEKEISKRARTFIPGEALVDVQPPGTGPSPQEIQAIKDAITKATSLEEIERLNHILQSGQIPGREYGGNRRGGAEEMEEDDDFTMDPGNGY